jgi:hypothetical protein
MAPMLLMEVSTIFLSAVRATFVPPTVTLLLQLSFALSFFLFRIVVTPVLWGQSMYHFFVTGNYQVECFPWYFRYFSFLVCVFIVNELN